MNKTELVVAAGKKVYFVDPEKVILMTERPGPITCLAFQQNHLYDAWYNPREDDKYHGIVEDIVEITPGPVAKREHLISALETPEGRMLDLSKNMIFGTWKGKPLVKTNKDITDMAFDEKNLYFSVDRSVYRFIDRRNVQEVARRDKVISKIHLHKGRLIEATSEGVTATLDNILIGKRDAQVTCFASLGKALYDSAGGDIYHTGNNKKIAKRDMPVSVMHVHEGQLLDASGNAIYDTLKDKRGKKPLWTFRDPVKAIISIPTDSWFEIIDRKKIFGRAFYEMLKEQFER